MYRDKSRHEIINKADYGIVTALDEEMRPLLKAICQYETVDLGKQDTRYYYLAQIRCLDGSNQTVTCALATEMGQQAAQNVTHDLIRAWNPRHLLLIGIAGGIPGREIRCGDIIVPSYVHYCEPGKLIARHQAQRYKRQPRWKTFDTSRVLLGAARAVNLEPEANWTKAIGNLTSIGRENIHPRLFWDEMVSSEEVWSDLKAAIVHEALERSDKIRAVDNEAAGVFNAAREAPNMPNVLVIKGISDLIENKDDTFHDYAASAAAAFAMAIITKVGGRWR